MIIKRVTILFNVVALFCAINLKSNREVRHVAKIKNQIIKQRRLNDAEVRKQNITDFFGKTY